MVRKRSGRPQDAVLGVELGGQSPAGESVVKLLLGQPGREFPVSVETETRDHMSNDVMHGPKSVVRAAEVAAQQWVTAVPFPGARRDLKHPMSAHCADQLIVGIVGTFAAGELDSETAMERMIRICQLGVDHVRLALKLFVGGTYRCIGMDISSRLETRSHFARKIWIHS